MARNSWGFVTLGLVVVMVGSAIVTELTWTEETERVNYVGELITPHTTKVEGYFIDLGLLGNTVGYRDAILAFMKKHPELEVVSAEERRGIYIVTKPRTQ